MKKYLSLLALVLFLVACQKENPYNEQINKPNINSGLLPVSTSVYNNFPEAILPATGNLPTEFYLDMPIAGNQGGQGSCVAWAVAYGLKSYQEKKYNPTVSWDEALCSPSYVYNQIKVGDCGSGSYVHDALNLIVEQGVCSLKSMGYDQNNCQNLPSDNQRLHALKSRFSKWERVRINTNIIKTAITTGFPIVIAANLDCGFYNMTPDSKGRFIWNYTDDNCSNGYHAMVVSGYNDEINAFKVLNSWGVGWGNNGYFWISYDVFLRRIDQAYIAWNYSANDDTLFTWKRKTDFQGKSRTDAVGFSINGLGYFGTGCHFISYGAFECLDDFYQYNPNSDSWVPMLNFPGGKRTQCFGFSIGNKGFIGGGYSMDISGNWIPCKDIWEYDPLNNSWKRMTDFVGEINPYMSFFSSPERGYVFDGLNLYEFNPSLNTWQIFDKPEAEMRRDAIGCYYNGKCYIGLGYYNTGSFTGISANTFYQFDLLTKSWSKIKEIDWKTRRGLSYYSYDSKVYFGFGNESLNDGSKMKNDFWEYNILTNEINQLPVCPSSTGYKEGFSIYERFFVGLGSDGASFPIDFWEFGSSK